MKESFEMALYWIYLEMKKNDDLRQRTIDQIQCILKEAPPTTISYHSFGKTLRKANPNGSKASFEKQPCQNETFLQATRLLTFLLKYNELLVELSKLSWQNASNELRIDA
jgi:hypothetical protein